MISLFSNRYTLSLILTALFIVGIGISLYSIYSLPSGLRLTSGYQPAFTTVYIVVGLTFVVGVLTLLYALGYKKEVLVFRDRALENALAQQEGDQSKSTISLDTVSAKLAESSNRKEKMQLALHAICKQIEAGQGAVYDIVEQNGRRTVELRGGYALSIGESTVISYEIGEGLIGQSAANGNTLYVDDVPNGYVKIVSGLGSASPKYLLIVPVKKQEHVTGIIELASFTAITEDQRKFVEEAAMLIGDKIA